MAIDIPFDGIDPDSLGGFDTVAAGLVHFKIIAVDEDHGDKGDLAVDLEVLRHSVSNQVGKVHREKLQKNLSSEMCRKKFMALAIAAELTTVDEIKQLAAHGKSPSIEYTHAVGKTVVMKLEDNEYNGRKFTRMSFDCVYHPAHKKANDCPLDKAALDATGVVLPPGRNIDGAVAANKANANGAKSGTVANPGKQAANVADVLSGI